MEKNLISVFKNIPAKFKNITRSYKRCLKKLTTISGQYNLINFLMYIYN